MGRIIKTIFLDIINNKVAAAYTLILAALSWASFLMEDSADKGLITILNVVLFTVPLMSILFSTIYLYNSSEFILLLLSQPIKRKKIWISLFIDLALSFILCFMIGSGIPLLIYSPNMAGIMMIISSCLISCIFISLSFLCCVYIRDKTIGIGVAVILWIFFTLLFDGIILFFVFQFSDYPIEKIVALMAAANPIDLSRIQILLYLDISAMMGYTGAIFKKFFGATYGILLSFSILCMWICVPFWLSLKRFEKMDL